MGRARRTPSETLILGDRPPRLVRAAGDRPRGRRGRSVRHHRVAPTSGRWTAVRSGCICAKRRSGCPWRWRWPARRSPSTARPPPSPRRRAADDGRRRTRCICRLPQRSGGLHLHGTPRLAMAAPTPALSGIPTPISRGLSVRDRHLHEGLTSPLLARACQSATAACPRCDAFEGLSKSMRGRGRPMLESVADPCVDFTSDDITRRRRLQTEADGSVPAGRRRDRRLRRRERRRRVQPDAAPAPATTSRCSSRR